MTGVGVAARGVLALSVIGLGIVAALAWQRRDRPGAVPFAASAGTLALVAAVVAIMGRIGGPHSLSWALLASLVLVFVSCWLWFVVAYTGVAGRAWAGPVHLVAFLPAVGVLTLGYLYLTGDPIPRTPMARGPFYLVLFTLPTLFVGALFMGSVILLVRSGLRHASANLGRCVALAVGAVAGGLLPLLVVSVLDPNGTASVAGFAVGASTATAGFGLAATRLSLFASVPVAEAIGRDRLVTEMVDPVVVVNADERVVDLNDAAERLLEADLEAVVGTSLAALLDVEAPVVEGETVTLEAEDGTHTFEVARTPVTYDGRLVGHALVLSDVTDRRTRRQRLEVLNRVLRHNLRNDMTAVMGYADLLADEDGADGDLLERIHETADALTALGDKAREIERIMAASAETSAETDFARIAQYVAAEARKRYPAADIDVSLEGETVVAAPDEVCWPVVWNLVENAVEHNDTEDPTVDIAVRPAGDRAELVVLDDGPGLPENERRAVIEGEEEPLSHGSGLGLWAVKWGTTRVGGEVTFADAEPRGTRVTVRLPLADATRAATDECEPA
jgi:signal transduction histidine kinase